MNACVLHCEKGTKLVGSRLWFVYGLSASQRIHMLVVRSQCDSVKRQWDSEF